MSNRCEGELGRRGFLRSLALMGTGAGVSTLMGACSEGGQRVTSPNLDVTPGRKWIRVDAMDVGSGELFSYDGFSDNPDSAFTSDVEMTGYSVSTSGEIAPLKLSIAKDSANSLSLVSVGDNHYRLVAGGV